MATIIVGVYDNSEKIRDKLRLIKGIFGVTEEVKGYRIEVDKNFIKSVIKKIKKMKNLAILAKSN